MAEVLKSYWRFERALPVIAKIEEVGAKHGRASTEGRRRWQPHAIQRRLSEEERASIVREYTEGARAGQLAEAFGISETAVLDLLKRAGVPRRNGKLNPEQVAEMRRLRESGWTYASIGSQFGVTKTAAMKRLSGMKAMEVDGRGWGSGSRAGG